MSFNLKLITEAILFLFRKRNIIILKSRRITVVPQDGANLLR
jgi:hypothetical protein